LTFIKLSSLYYSFFFIVAISLRKWVPHAFRVYTG
jgi:hypothetical protein